MASLKADFQQANDLLQRGRLDEAAQAYRSILERDPNHFLATFNLGIVEAQSQRLTEAELLFAKAETLQPKMLQVLLTRAKLLAALNRGAEAVACYDRLLAAHPDNFAALNDRASALIVLGRHDEALRDLERALLVQPSDPVALYNKASVHLAKGQEAEALAALDRAIEAKADFALALVFKGNLLSKSGQPEDAIVAFERAIAIDPKNADAFNNLGSVLLDMKRWPEALAQFDRALALAPLHLEARVNRGRVLGKLGRLDEELAAYDQVIATHPSFAGAHLCRGIALTASKRLTEALKSFDSGLALDPANANGWQARGNALAASGAREEALICFDRAIALKPTLDTALNNRALTLRLLRRYDEAAEAFAKLYALDPNYPHALGNFFNAKLYCSDWQNYDAINAQITEAVRNGKPVETPFSLLVHSESEADQLLCAKQYAQDLVGVPTRWRPVRHTNDKIRVAYVSSDLQNHATAHLMAGLFEAHTRERFEFTAMSFGSDCGTPMRGRLRAAFDRFIDAAEMPETEMVRLLRELKIDIAVDLKGFTNEARPKVFRDRAAPLQVNFLGYPCTWGSDCMDYIIADERLIPRASEAHYSEKVVWMPESYQPNDRKRPIADYAPPRAKLGLPETGFVFCCFNGNYKITPNVYDIWMRLLLKVEGSVLWLLDGGEVQTRNLQREAAARGVDPARLVFAPPLDTPIHLARQRLADLFLDTVPVNAHTTASDALWAGLPILTCHGSAFAGRVAASLLYANGLPELIAKSLAEYEAIAYRLATSPEEMAAVRAKVARNRDSCALFDTDRFRKHLEAAFVIMHERQQRGEAPASFAVPA